MKRLSYYTLFFVVCIVFGIVIKSFLFEVIQIVQASMEDAIQENELVCINKLDRKISHNDIALLRLSTDSRKLLIKRCIGMPGDTIRSHNAVIEISGKTFDEMPTVRKVYEITLLVGLNPYEILDSLESVGYCILSYDGNANFLADLNRNQLSQLEKSSIVCKITPRSTLTNQLLPVWESLGWTRDSFGPAIVPFKGMEIQMTAENIAIYKEAIINHEGSTIEIVDTLCFVNGQLSKSFCFSKDYYFFMGDNRKISNDSRFWGFVPGSAIIGSVAVILPIRRNTRIDKGGDHTI